MHTMYVYTCVYMYICIYTWAGRKVGPYSCVAFFDPRCTSVQGLMPSTWSVSKATYLDLPSTLNWNLIVLIWWYLESNRG